MMLWLSAGVLVGLLTPARPIHGEASPRAERYCVKLQPLSSLVALPVFALFAAGVHFETLSPALLTSPVVIGIVAALVVGKPLGIMATAWLSTHPGGLSMPKGLRVRDMFPAACACGIGFTVSLLIASLAYTDAELSAESRFGVLMASLVAAAISGVLLSLQSKRYERERAAAHAAIGTIGGNVAAHEEPRPDESELVWHDHIDDEESEETEDD